MKNLKLKSSVLLASIAVQCFSGLSVNAEELTLSAKLAITDERGNYVDSLNGMKTLYGEIELSDAPGTADVFVGAYDAEGNLVSVGKTELGENETSAEFSFETSGEQVSVEAFVWDKNQKPLTDKVNVWNVRTEGLYEWFGLAAEGFYQTTAENVTTKWVWGDTPDGAFWSFDPAIDQYLIFNNAAYGGKWIKYQVTAGGNVYESEPRLMSYYPLRGAETISGARKTTPNEYVFEVDGMELVLLEVTDSDTAKFKVMSKNGLGDAVSYCPYFNPVGGAETENLPQAVKDVQASNPNVTGVISFHGMYYYLNNDLKNAGYIPQSVLNNIDNSITVITNMGPWGAVECIMPAWGGITLPDINEVIKYKDRLGFADDGKDWWTRSIINNDYQYIYVKGSDPVNYNTTAGGYQVPWDQLYANVRPMMYLNEDFFTNVKVDLSKAGAEIKKAVRKLYGYDELLNAGYTEEELALYYTGSEISNLEISGEMKQGSTLTASVDGDANATFEWQIAGTEDGLYEVVATGNSYAPTFADNGKYLKAVAYGTNGDSLETAPMLISSIREDFAGTLSDVTIKGIFYAGNYLYADYTLNDMTEDEIANYAWYVSDAENGVYSPAGIEKSVATEDIEADRYYYCEITIADGTKYTTPVQKVDKRIWARWDNDSTQDPGNIDTATEALTTAALDSNPEYMFTVDGHDFVLLDTIGTSDTARYKVIAENTYGKYKYSELDGEAFTSQFPEAITSHVDYKVFRTGTLNSWMGYTIGGCVNTDEDYNGYHGFYPGNIDDFVKYKNIVGLRAYNRNDYLVSDNPTPVFFGTHTNAVQSADRNMFALGVEGETVVIKNDCNNQWAPDLYYEVRPIFYLDKDFFTEEAAFVEYMGSKVQEMIAASSADGVGAL